MKTKELIRQLQEADPSGEEEVCVGNVPIIDISRLPAYYDGSLQVIERDENGRIKGGKFVRQGWKINVFTWAFSDILWDYPELPIDYSQLGEYYGAQTKANHDAIRESVKDVEYKIEVEYFQKWAVTHAEKLGEDSGQDIKDTAKEFFDANLSRNDPFPSHIAVYTALSYVDSRNKQWDEQLEVYRSVDDGIQIRKKHGNQSPQADGLRSDGCEDRPQQL